MKRYSTLVLFALLAAVLLTGCLGGNKSQSYQISGQVTDETGRGIAGVMLAIEGTSQSTSKVTTDEEGKWTAKISGTVSVTPQRTGVDFSPEQQTITSENLQNVNFEGTTDKIVGRVVINGNAPDRPITLRISKSNGSDEQFDTDASGHFAIAPEDYADLAYIRLKAHGLDSFDRKLADEMGLLSWFNVENIPNEAGFLPDIDLYDYGLALITPKSLENVSLPYSGKISKYDRNVNPSYRFFFYNAFRDYLGYSAICFEDETYSFDGKLLNGNVLSEDAFWYVAGFFLQDGITISVNTYGTRVEL